MRRLIFCVFLVACGTDSSDDDGGIGDGGGGRDVPIGSDSSFADARDDMDSGVESDAPTSDTGVSSGLDADDMELYRLINEYRASLSLPAIPLSPSLSEVARQHVADLSENSPNMGSCNLHSWSGEGSWSACCYTPDHAEASCMWDKPRELTDYPGNGYEISAGGVGSAERALSLWQTSPGHHDVIINAGSWSTPWGAMGVAITPGSYAHVWFGREADPAAR